MNDINEFLIERKQNIENLSKCAESKKSSIKFLADSVQLKYSYNFDWLGLPIIQYPQDIVALQEIIWKTKPDIVIETGIARGGSLIFYASMINLLNNNGKVIGIDIDIREHNKLAIEQHFLSKYIHLIEGSSTDKKTFTNARKHIQKYHKVMVILDSNHTHEHVLEELKLYSTLVTKDCYLVVMDSSIQDMPNHLFENRPWGVDNNPKTAVHEFLKINDEFQIDESIQNKLLITAAIDGYLKCIK